MDGMLTFAKRFTLDPPPFRNVMLIIKGNKKFQARLGSVNILILVFLAFGIGVQMIYRDITIDFMCVSICSFFLYHYRGNVINQVDVTTRLLNRRCFKRNTENM